MKQYALLYEKKLEKWGLVCQDYVDTNLKAFKEHLEEVTEFIDELSISTDDKKAMLLFMKYHRILIEDALSHLKKGDEMFNQAMMKLFSRLSPEEQKKLISKDLPDNVICL